MLRRLVTLPESIEESPKSKFQTGIMRALRDHVQRRSVRSVICRSQGLCIDRTLRAGTQEESEFEQLLGRFLPAKRCARENPIELDKICRAGLYAAARRISERHGLEQAARIGNSRCIDKVGGRKCQTESRWQHPNQGPVGYGLHPASDECVVPRQRVGEGSDRNKVDRSMQIIQTHQAMKAIRCKKTQHDGAS